MTTCAPNCDALAELHAVAQDEPGREVRRPHGCSRRGRVEPRLQRLEHPHHPQPALAVGERRRGRSRMHSTKCSHSIRSGSRFGIRGLQMSPERVMYSP